MNVRAAGLLFLAAVAAASTPSPTESPKRDTSTVRWGKPGYKINHAEFSPDGRELLLELRLDVQHPGMLRDEVDARNKKERRYDPLIGVLTLADQHFDELVHGREGHFSPDGRAVAFVAQAVAAPFEQLETLDELEGNYAAVYDRAKRTTLELAQPKHGIHTQPFFSPDGARVNYVYLMPRTGTAYVSQLTEFDLASRKSRVLYETEVVGATPGHFEWFAYFGERLLASVAMPRIATKYAREPVAYTEHLLDIRDDSALELFSWGPQDKSLRDMNRLVGVHDGAMIFDSRWRPLTKNGEPGPPLGPTLEVGDDPGVPSPDGRLLAHAILAQDGSRWIYVALVVEELESGKVIASFPIDKARSLRPECIAWSADSSRLAWSDDSSGNWVDDHDTLFVAKLP